MVIHHIIIFFLNYFSRDEYDSEKMIVQGFGHSTYEMALENASLARIKKLVCMHYNPVHSDDKLDCIQRALSKLESLKEGFLPQIILSKEGMVLDV